MDNFLLSLYQILKLIEYSSCQERFDYSLFEEENLKITDDEIKIILISALKEELISGIILIPGTLGFKAISPHLTTKGYQYLNDNTSMKKAYKIAKEIKGWIPMF